MRADEAMRMLVSISNHFRGDPSVFLNRAHPADGRLPVDIAVYYGGVRVAEVLVGHGAIFLPRHLEMAQLNDHPALADFIS